MARGSVVGEPIVSQAQSRAFDEGWDKMEHSDDGVRGRFVWRKGRGLVPADEVECEERAVNAPIMVDRFYEGATTKTVDEKGRPVTVDIGSRRKHRAFMKERGLTTADDFSPRYYEQIHKDRQAKVNKERREVIARRLYEIDKP